MSPNQFLIPISIVALNSLQICDTQTENSSCTKCRFLITCIRPSVFALQSFLINSFDPKIIFFGDNPIQGHGQYLKYACAGHNPPSSGNLSFAFHMVPKKSSDWRPFGVLREPQSQFFI
ncbi:hypothetical protein ACTXT7_005560 [Hymenolepis weldensis]